MFDTRVSSRVLFQVSRSVKYLEELDLHQGVLFYLYIYICYVMVVLGMFMTIQLCCTLYCILNVSAVKIYLFIL